MVEFTLPANSKISKGKTFAAEAGATRIKKFKVYRFFFYYWDTTYIFPLSILYALPFYP